MTLYVRPFIHFIGNYYYEGEIAIMMKNKKVIAVVLILVMLGLLGTSELKAKETEGKGLYIISKKCSQGYIAYAENKIHDFICGSDLEEQYKDKKIYLGTPFSFINENADIFYFPIICNEEIIYMLRVFPVGDDRYEGILGKTFVDDLNEIKKYASNKTPMAISMESNMVVAYVGKERKVLIEYPTYFCDNSKPVTDSYLIKIINKREYEYDTVNIYEKSTQITFVEEDFRLQYESNDRGILTPNYKYLSTPIIETQGNDSWCTAYSTAWIIRYIFTALSDNTSAYDVMCSQYTNPTSSDSLYDTDAVTYGYMRGLNPVHVSYTLSDTTLINQIVALRPVFLNMQRFDNSGNDYYHAIVLRGYSSTYSTWSVWNPWYSYYDTFSMGGNYVPAGATTITYYYYHTVYNW